MRPRDLVEASLLVALSVVLFMASNYLPLLGMVVSLFCPVPLVIMGLRASVRGAILGAAVASLLVTALVGVMGGALFLFSFAILGVSLGYFVRRFGRATEILFYGVLVSLASKILLIAVVKAATGVNPMAMDPSTLKEGMGWAAGLFEGMGLSADSLQKQIDQMSQILHLMFPAVLVMASALDCVLSYAVSAFVLKRIGKGELPPIPNFGGWRFPKSLFWAYFASFLFTLLGGGKGFLFLVGLNLRLVVTMLFFLEGAAVLWYFLARKGVPIALRVMACVFVVLVPFLSNTLVILGIVDLWLDLRSRFGK
ncbi:MAG TPA: YybS family protein [Thermosynergistes sp.]|nr:YybS family protein [Thermosynergistes sp.]